MKALGEEKNDINLSHHDLPLPSTGLEAPLREQGSSTLVTGSSFSGKSHLIYRLFHHFEDYHRLPAQGGFLFFVASPQKEEYTNFFNLKKKQEQDCHIYPLDKLKTHV